MVFVAFANARPAVVNTVVVHRLCDPHSVTSCYHASVMSQDQSEQQHTANTGPHAESFFISFLYPKGKKLATTTTTCCERLIST